ncbi:SAUR-like auxin-responsive protein family [Striga asiatica]|uniref:SAUR-like auxin-responsive protein family n=1 Tax=Striga asiatica TaxID=4170 RepID=A0A5A7QAR1_STRAF|nr:SAUR-like auxin-responsive protein family [Striga asiatica]
MAAIKLDLPVPGGPNSRYPLFQAFPTLLYSSFLFRNRSMSSITVPLTSSSIARVWKFAGWSRLTDCHGLRPIPCIRSFASVWSLIVFFSSFTALDFSTTCGRYSSRIRSRRLLWKVPDLVPRALVRVWARARPRRGHHPPPDLCPAERVGELNVPTDGDVDLPLLVGEDGTEGAGGGSRDRARVDLGGEEQLVAGQAVGYLRRERVERVAELGEEEAAELAGDEVAGEGADEDGGGRQGGGGGEGLLGGGELDFWGGKLCEVRKWEKDREFIGVRERERWWREDGVLRETMKDESEGWFATGEKNLGKHYIPTELFKQHKISIRICMQQMSDDGDDRNRLEAEIAEEEQRQKD